MSFANQSLPLPDSELQFANSVLLAASAKETLAIYDSVVPTSILAGTGKIYKKTSDAKLYWQSATGPEYDLTSSGDTLTTTDVDVSNNGLAVSVSTEYHCDTTGGKFTLNLPAVGALSNGDFVRFIDVLGNFSLDALSVAAGAGTTIVLRDGTTNAIRSLVVNYAVCDFHYDSANTRWVVSEVSAGDMQDSYDKGSTVNVSSVDVVWNMQTLGDIRYDRYVDNATSAMTKFYKNRSAGANNELQSGDSIGRIAFAGDDDTFSQVIGANIESKSTEAWTAGNHGTELIFRTTDTSTASLVDKLQIGNAITARSQIIHYGSAFNGAKLGSDSTPYTMQLIKSRGDESTPIGVSAGDELAAVEISAYNDGLFPSTGFKMVAKATQNWTTANRGTNMTFSLNLENENSLTQIMQFDEKSNVSLSSDSGAFIPNKLTTTQRDNLTGVEAMFLYNTTKDFLEYRDSTKWRAVRGLLCEDKNALFTAEADAKYHVSGGPYAITLPGSAENGAQITIIDVTGDFALNNITLLPTPPDSISGDPLYVLDVNGGSWVIEYNTANNIWEFITRPSNGFIIGFTKQRYFQSSTLTDATTISWDLNTAQVASVTLGGNRTLGNPTNMKDGGKYELVIKQDGAGNRLLSFQSAYLFPGGVSPTLSSGSNQVDIIRFVSDGTNMYGDITKNYA